MKRALKYTAILASTLCLAATASAKEKKPKPGPLSGTWECTSHGGPHGDLPFTLYLEQVKEQVSGSITSPIGSTEISSGTFKNKKLEIRLDTPQGNYLLKAKFNKGQLSGEWSHETEAKGTWEGKKKAEPPSKG